MNFTPLLSLGTLVFAFVNFLKYVLAKNWNSAITQIVAWVSGVAGVFIAAHTEYAKQIMIGTANLGQMDWQTQVFFGLIATSILTTVNEVKKAIDNTDSAKTPPLLKSLVKTTEAATAVPPSAVATGVANLKDGSAVVSDKAATATSRIFVSPQTTGIKGNLRVTVPGPGIITISSTNDTDNGPVAYQIL
jgi:hypothetical protein